MKTTKLNKGDRVEVLDETISGSVVSVEKDTVIIETEEGFQLSYSTKEVIPIKTEEELRVTSQELSAAVQEKQQEKTKKSKRIPPKQRLAPAMEVDLHIHNLVNSEKGLSNFDMLNIQLDTAKNRLDFAIRKRIQKVVFIHGVGEGVLRAELETLFRRYDNIKYYDADYQKYGRGATEVYIFQNNNL